MLFKMKAHIFTPGSHERDPNTVGGGGGGGTGESLPHPEGSHGRRAGASQQPRRASRVPHLQQVHHVHVHGHSHGHNHWHGHWHGHGHGHGMAREVAGDEHHAVVHADAVEDDASDPTVANFVSAEYRATMMSRSVSGEGLPAARVPQEPGQPHNGHFPPQFLSDANRGQFYRRPGAPPLARRPHSIPPEAVACIDQPPEDVLFAEDWRDASQALSS